jgi:hypothetical protein
VVSYLTLFSTLVYGMMVKDGGDIKPGKNFSALREKVLVEENILKVVCVIFCGLLTKKPE